MFPASDLAVARRYLGFVDEVLEFKLVSRTLRALILQPTYPGPHEACELAAVFFATGVTGVAIASWATNRPSGAPVPKTLRRAFGACAKHTFREVTAPDEILVALKDLHCALEEQLHGDLQVALILASGFTGTAFNLAASAAATGIMPIMGNWALANYLEIPALQPSINTNEL